MARGEDAGDDNVTPRRLAATHRNRPGTSSRARQPKLAPADHTGILPPVRCARHNCGPSAISHIRRHKLLTCDSVRPETR